MRSTALRPACLLSLRGSARIARRPPLVRDRSRGLKCWIPEELKATAFRRRCRSCGPSRTARTYPSRSPGCACLRSRGRRDRLYGPRASSCRKRSGFRYRLEGARTRLAGRRNAPRGVLHQSEAQGAIAFASSPATTTASGTRRARRSTSPSCPRSTRRVASSRCAPRRSRVSPWSAYRWRLRQVRASLDRTLRGAPRRTDADRAGSARHPAPGFPQRLHAALRRRRGAPARGARAEEPLRARPATDAARSSTRAAALRGLRSPDPGADDLEPALSRIPGELGIREAGGFRIVAEGRARPLRPGRPR